MSAPLRIPSSTKIHKTQHLQDESKEACRLYIETVDIEKLLTQNIVSSYEHLPIF